MHSQLKYTGLIRSGGMVKNQYEQQNQFVFTLSDDLPEQQSVANSTVSPAKMATETMPEWERSLEQLRQHKKSKIAGQTVRKKSYQMHRRYLYLKPEDARMISMCLR